MKQWYTARELAELALPGLPTTKSAFIRRAAREEYPHRQRQGRGGGREYNIESLPEQARVELARRHLASVSVSARDQDEAERQQRIIEGLQKLAGVSDAKKARVRARTRVLELLATFLHAGTLPRDRGTELFAAEYNQGSIDAPDDVRSLVPHVERSTLYRWQKRMREMGPYGLVSGHGSNRGRSKVSDNAELRDLVLGLIAKDPHIKPKWVYEYLLATKPELSASVSKRSVQRFMKSWKEQNASLFTYMSNPDEWKNKFLPAFGDASAHIHRLNQMWELDSTPADVLLTDGRHSVIGVIDIYSRRTKLLVSKTSKASAVAAVFRKALLDWGVPEVARTDNGRDYKSNMFTDVVKSLGVEQVFCAPFASEQKPFIERVFRTFSHSLVELLPGYIGHSVADRKAIEARKSFAQRIMTRGKPIPVKMSAAELQAFCDRWCDKMYQHQVHSALDGKTPWQMATEWTGEVRRISNERSLDLLLVEAPKVRTVGKKGLRVNNQTFVGDGLVPNARVKVRIDPADLGRVYVYSEDGATFITIAENPKLASISQAELAVATKKKVRKEMAKQAGELRQLRKQIAKDPAQVILEHRAEQAASLTAFPQASVEYSTPQLDAAADAARALDQQSKPFEYNQADVDEGAAIITSIERERQARKEAEEAERREIREQYEEWKRLRAMDPDTLSEEDRKWVADCADIEAFRLLALDERMDANPEGLIIEPRRRRALRVG